MSCPWMSSGWPVDSAQVDGINSLTARFADVHRRIDLSRFTVPLNLAEEREATIRALRDGIAREPQFHYHPLPASLVALIDATVLAVSTTDAISDLLVDDLLSTKRMLSALQRSDDDQITSLTVAEFGEPSESLISESWSVLDALPDDAPDEPQLTADESVDVLRSALASAGLNGWSVKIDSSMHARMSVRVIEHLVKVQADARFTNRELTRLRIHELGTHVARSENGSRQPLSILSLGLPGYLMTEEGLAVWHEVEYGVTDTTTMRRYALRVIAASAALKHGFFDTFLLLAQRTTPPEAFAIALRAKRGFRKPSLPGAHVKDQVYLRGFLEVRARLSEHPDDYPLLMAGKVGIPHLELMRHLRDHGLLLAPLIEVRDFDVRRGQR